MRVNSHNLKQKLNRKVFKSLTLLNALIIALAFLLLIGDVSAIAWKHHNTHMATPAKMVVRKNVQKAKPVVATTPAPTTSPAATTTAPPKPAPVSVPQTVNNNQHLALLCSQAQSSYDQLITSENSQLNSQYETTTSDGNSSGESMAEIDSQINGLYTNYNIEITQQYSAYLNTVKAVPGCAVDFQEPVLYQPVTP